MTISFQSWMQAVWLSLIEPADIARKALAMRFETRDLWLALALVAVLSALLQASIQTITPAPMVFQDRAIVLSPFSFAAIIGVFLFFFVFGIYYFGQKMGGVGTLPATLTLMVWFQAISLTLEVMQVLLVLISPYLAALFGMISLGGLLWCILNFIDVLHALESRGKAAIILVLALIATFLSAVLILMMLGVRPPGGLT